MNENITNVRELEAEERKQKAIEREKYYFRLLYEKEFASHPDDDIRNPWHDLMLQRENVIREDESQTFALRVKEGMKSLRNYQVKKVKISRFDAAGVQLMSRIESKEFDAQNSLTASDQEFLYEFLTRLVGRELHGFKRVTVNLKRLNTFLNTPNVLDQEFENKLTTRKGYESVKNIAYKTRNVQVLRQAMKKLGKMTVHYNGSVYLNSEMSLLKKDDKFTLAEYSAICDLASLYDTFKKLEEAGFNYENSFLMSVFYSNSRIAKQLVQKIDQDISQMFQNTDNNLLAFTNEAHEQVIVNPTSTSLISSFIKYIKSFVVNLSYVAALSLEKDTKFVDKYQQFDIKQMLYTDMYEIDVTKLIDKNVVKTLQDHYGANWENIVRLKFKNICYNSENNLSAQQKEESLTSTSNNLTSFGNTNLKENDYKEMSSNQVNYNGEKGLMTSSISAKVINANLDKLQEEIRNEINNPKKETIPSDARDELNILKDDLSKKRSNKSTDNNLLKGSFINVSVDKNESLENMSSNKLLKILKEKDCVRPVKLSAIEDVVNISR